MFLFIFESIGTSELMLIGVIALIFLGPRKMPEMARKIGKMMNEFRGTANEFKETWQREVDFSEEAKSFDLNALENDTVSRVKDAPVSENLELLASPEIKEADPSLFAHLRPADSEPVIKKEDTAETNHPVVPEANDKKTWL